MPKERAEASGGPSERTERKRVNHCAEAALRMKRHSAGEGSGTGEWCEWWVGEVSGPVGWFEESGK